MSQATYFFFQQWIKAISGDQRKNSKWFLRRITLKSMLLWKINAQIYWSRRGMSWILFICGSYLKLISCDSCWNNSAFYDSLINPLKFKYANWFFLYIFEVLTLFDFLPLEILYNICSYLWIRDLYMSTVICDRTNFFCWTIENLCRISKFFSSV